MERRHHGQVGGGQGQQGEARDGRLVEMQQVEVAPAQTVLEAPPGAGAEADPGDGAVGGDAQGAAGDPHAGLGMGRGGQDLGLEPPTRDRGQGLGQPEDVAADTAGMGPVVGADDADLHPASPVETPGSPVTSGPGLPPGASPGPGPTPAGGPVSGGSG